MRKAFYVVAVVALANAPVVWAAGDWSAATSKVDELKSKQQELRKLTPAETRRIVTAVCNEADEE